MALDELGEREGLSGLVLEGELDVSSLEGGVDTVAEALLVGTQVVGSLLVKGIVGVSVGKEGGETNDDGREGENGDPITTKNVEADVAFPVNVGMVQLKKNVMRSVLVLRTFRRLGVTQKAENEGVP